MIQSDALSRCLDHVPEKDTNNENIVLLPDELFIKLINMELTKIIESAATSDEFVKNMDKVLSMKGVPPIKSNLSDWKIEDGILFYQDQCYIPDNPKVRKMIVQQIHDSPMMGHPGQDSTLEMVQRLVFAGSVLWTEKIHRTKLNWTVVQSIFRLRLPKFGVILVAGCLISKIIQNCSKTG